MVALNPLPNTSFDSPERKLMRRVLFLVHVVFL